ncbi:alpha/beta hydrolase [Streptomyces sp. enrichment culture]|uniref:alpha/beta hydrolase n=1 Tax=Streptomyces sp. enrichment culture TaxID=1795815 RepID=UPI003F57B3DA
MSSPSVGVRSRGRPASAAGSSSPAVREIVLKSGGLRLSALLAEPRRQAPRAVVLAVPGGGMRAGYFHQTAAPGLSLLTLGAELGLTVLAVDRPGYGQSAARLPEGLPLVEQAAVLSRAVTGFLGSQPTGTPLFVLAHSYGGKVALTLAARHHELPLAGLAVSGCGHRFTGEADTSGPGLWRRRLRGNNWGPLGLYPPGTFTLAQSLGSAMPPREAAELPAWPKTLEQLAPRVRVPVRFTFAEHERRWRHDPQALSELARLLRHTPVSVDRQPDAGHNISLGWAARAYHLRMLAFLEECLLRRTVG